VKYVAERVTISVRMNELKTVFDIFVCPINSSVAAVTDKKGD